MSRILIAEPEHTALVHPWLVTAGVFLAVLGLWAGLRRRPDQQGLQRVELESAELQRRQSKGLYLPLFQSGVPMLLIDRSTGAIADANTAAAQFYGWDVATLQQMQISSIDAAAHQALTAWLDPAGPVPRAPIPSTHRLASGEMREVEIFASPVSLDDGQRTLAIVSDVTARKQAERALLEKEYQLTEAQRLAHIGSFTRTEHGVGAWSDEMFRVFGLEPGTPVPSPSRILELVHPEDRELFLRSRAAHHSGEPTGPVELRVVLPDGRTRYLLERGERRSAPDGTIYVAGTLQDITDRKLAEQAVHRSAERLRLAIGAARQGLWDFDLDTRRAVVSAPNADRPGFSEQVETLDLDQFIATFHPADRERVGTAFQRYAEGASDTFEQEFRLALPNGQFRWTHSTGQIVERRADGSARRIVGVVTDIAERRAFIEALHLSLREKEALLKEVHHRVKNNLQVISSLLRLEFGRTAEPGVKAVLGEMQSRITSMALLHETLYRSDDLSRVDLSTYLNRLVQQLFHASAPASGRIALRVSLEPTFVDLEQAVPCGLLVTELMANSLKHGFPGNRAGVVHVSLSAPGGGRALRLSVADTGIGLPPDFEARRTHSLGLALVSDLSRQLRGSLAVGTGPGAAFTLTFTPRPLAPQRPSGAPTGSLT